MHSVCWWMRETAAYCDLKVQVDDERWAGLPEFTELVHEHFSDPPTPTPICALSSDAWLCEECSHVQMQTQTCSCSLKTGDRLSNCYDLGESPWLGFDSHFAGLFFFSDTGYDLYSCFPEVNLVYGCELWSKGEIAVLCHKVQPDIFVKDPKCQMDTKL